MAEYKPAVHHPAAHRRDGLSGHHGAEDDQVISHTGRILRFGSRFIDYRAAIWGAFFMASIVFGINYFRTWDLPGSLTASVKQGLYTFLFGGMIMKLCEYISTTLRVKPLALFLSVLIPSLFAVGLTFILHSMKGTPMPVASTVPTAILIVPVTAVWGYRKRKKKGMTAQESPDNRTPFDND